MRTLVISDLHLGATNRSDLLRRPELRAPLLEALEAIDRLVILGDVLELREAPHRAAADLAAGFFEDVGRALGADGELVLMAGNHDHGLVAGWIDERLQTEDPGFLGLEQRVDPQQVGTLIARLADLARPARTTVAYPGIWLRDDVYAMHGHYSDIHSTVPTFERLAAGAMAKWVVEIPEHGASADDYEAALAPIFAWMHALTQRSTKGVLKAGAGASARAWVALAGKGRRRNPIRMSVLGAGYYLAIKTLDRVIGPLDHDLSGPALRRGGLTGINEVLRRLDVRAPYVLWGHSHRSGPWPRDDAAEWTSHAGGRILNTGCWVYQRHFLSPKPNDSPYWPGTAVLVEDDGPPQLLRLLGDRGHAELGPQAR